MLKYMANMYKNIYDDIIFSKVNINNCDVPIIEKSQKLRVAELVAKMGKNVIIQDNKNVLDLVNKEYGDIFKYKLLD